MAESILFVDDDSMVLNALERTFFETGYRTCFALNADDAFRVLASQQIDMVVSDIRMLPVSGYDFLKSVRTQYPKIIRIVLSAYGDRQMMLKVICEGVAKVYLPKPWNNRELIEGIAHVFAMYGELFRLNTASFFAEGWHLPSPPVIYSKMVRMVEDGSNLRDVATLIETDPSCTVNVLKLVNSAFYGISIGTVHQALAYLGVNSVKDVVLVSEIFNATGGARTDRHIQLHRHMIITSTLLHGLHQRLLGRRIPDEFSMAGMLADIGRLLLLDQDPDRYGRILDAFGSPDAASLVDLEMKEYAISHTKLGALALDWWNLPAGLVEACCFHHQAPSGVRVLPDEVAALIHAADTYAWRIAECKDTVAVSDDVKKMLSITDDQLDEHVAAVLNRIDYRK